MQSSDLLVPEEVVADVLHRLELAVRALPRHEDARVVALERVEVVDVEEVAQPAIDAEQVERRRRDEVDRRLVGAEERADLGDAAQRRGGLRPRSSPPRPPSTSGAAGRCRSASRARRARPPAPSRRRSPRRSGSPRRRRRPTRSSSAATVRHREQQVGRRHPAGLRGAGAGDEGGVEHVDVDGQVRPARRRRPRSRGRTTSRIPRSRTSCMKRLVIPRSACQPNSGSPGQ